MPQSLSKIYVHIIFSTSKRVPYLNNPQIRDQVWAYIAGILDNLGSTAIKIGGTEDHVHILCTFPRTRCVADLLKEIKRSSSIWIKERGPSLEEFHWQSGYGPFSMGQSHVDQVRQYIENQEAHHLQRTFQEEFREFLRKYEIDWNEQYVWD